MPIEDMSLASSAIDSIFSAMSKLVLDTDITDFAVTCGDKEWKVHSTVLAVRSPFFKAAITNNMAEKLQMKIDIKDFDPETMEEVINYMYGKHIEKAPAKFLFEAAERFQMDDLKEDVIKLAEKRMKVENVIELGHLAEHYNIESFLVECAKFIVKNNVEMKEEDLSSKLTVMVLRIYASEKSEPWNQKLKKSKANDCNEYRSVDASLVALCRKLRRDNDHRDLTLIVDNKCFKLHSIILAMRSPFFKAAITNIMTEKLEMQIEIKDLDVETVWEVIQFMYGDPIGKSPIKFLFKATERFQMDDLRVDVVKIAKKRMNVENVVEFGILAEMYNIERFLGDCAEFIVKNDVEMKDQEMTPKLATIVLSNLKDANRMLNDENIALKKHHVLLDTETLHRNALHHNALQELKATKQKLKASEIELQNYKRKSLWNTVWQ